MEQWTLPHQVVEIRERITEMGEMGPWRAYKYTLDSDGRMDSYTYLHNCLDR